MDLSIPNPQVWFSFEKGQCNRILLHHTTHGEYQQVTRPHRTCLPPLISLPPENSSSSDKSNATDYLNWTWQMSQARRWSTRPIWSIRWTFLESDIVSNPNLWSRLTGAATAMPWTWRGWKEDALTVAQALWRRNSLVCKSWKASDLMITHVILYLIYST